jgi:hypothetical protein
MSGDISSMNRPMMKEVEAKKDKQLYPIISPI